MNSASGKPSKYDEEKLLPVSSEKLIAWTSGLRRIRDAHRTLGFRLSTYGLEIYESLRSRGPNELGLEDYLDEVLREAFKVPGGRWDVDSRKTLPQAARSPYLDWLDAQISRGNFGYLGAKKIPGALDPNYILYANMSFSDPTERRRYTAVMEQRKAQEVEALNERIRPFAPKSTVTGAWFTNVLTSIAEELKVDIALVTKGRDPRVLLRREIADGISMYLEWTDAYVLRKWSDLQVVLIVQETDRPLPRPFDEKAWPFVASLDSFLPGGLWYVRKNDEGWEHVVLCALAHIEFLRLCGQPD